MNRVKTIVSATILISVVLPPAYAGVVHKWVDEKGITHYSDEAPVSGSSEMTQIEISEPAASTTRAKNDYYSIANQWQRMLDERLKRAKLKLEHDRLKAARQDERLDEFYVREPVEKRYVGIYRGKRPHHRPHKPSPYRNYRNHPNSRLLFGKFPPGLHPGRNL